MSRPKPNILREYVDDNTHRYEQILEANAVWAVYYKGKPFNLKSGNYHSNHPGPKYKKTSFANPGHAYNLANKLNYKFNCTDFTVEKFA
tara:strand:- start:173 stop:439 length:267 start_codon:yes stop_codon:yes gene_type:complete